MFPPVLGGEAVPGPGARPLCDEAEAAEGEGVRPGVRPQAGQAGVGGAGQVGVARLQVRKLPPPEECDTIFRASQHSMNYWQCLFRSQFIFKAHLIFKPGKKMANEWTMIESNL